MKKGCKVQPIPNEPQVIAGDPAEDVPVFAKLPPFTTHHLSIDELEEETK